MPSSILELPDELFLEIIKHLPYLPYNRRSELVTLSTVNKRIGNIATRVLHRHLYISVRKLESIVDLYIATPDLAKKVRYLDLYGATLQQGNNRWSESTPSLWNGCRYHDTRKRCEELRTKAAVYTRVVQKLGLPAGATRNLEGDLMCGDSKASRALLAVLLAALPSLRCVYLGNIGTKDLVKLELDHLCGSSTLLLHTRNRLDQYISQIRMYRAPKLETIELMRIWSA
jgi:hypothetical protein